VASSGPAAEGVPAIEPLRVDGAAAPARRSTGFPDLDRVLGGGLVAGSVVLLVGPPGIGKSTLLLQWLSAMGDGGAVGLLVSGEESKGQVAGRAARLGIAGEAISFAPGRELEVVVAAARALSPDVLAVDSIQALRHTDAGMQPGGVAQVRMCTDALVEVAKSEGIAVVLAGHVTKDGDLAGPRALEHAVDVVLTFEGDPRSGLRVVTGGKNRFGTEGEAAWFQMGASGLSPIDPSELLRSSGSHPGAAVALPLAGRRALAVEVQALVSSGDGPARRQVTGLELRRFQQVAAVLERSAGIPLGRAELFGAVAGGIKVDDPAADLAIAAALYSAAMDIEPPADVAFVGEIALTGQVRPAPGAEQRLAAARAAGCTTVVAPAGRYDGVPGVGVVEVTNLRDAIERALSPAGTRERRRAS
jgi:DNA repair protein RadA/Sms